MKAILCLLTMNEINGCKRDIPRLPRNLFDKVVAIDGNSNDGTVEYLLSQGIEVRTQIRPGYNGALSEVFLVDPLSSVIIFHPKGTVDPGILVDLNQALMSGNDLVIASRMILGARNEDDNKIFRFRKWFGKSVGWYLYLMFKRQNIIRVSDPLHGIRGLSSNFYRTLIFEPGRITGDLEMIVSAYKGEAKICEIPASESPRHVGKTHFPTLRSGLRLLRYLTSIPLVAIQMWKN